MAFKECKEKSFSVESGYKYDVGEKLSSIC
jgi:hypothetical protein